jgi:hypothetical protein
MKTSPETPPFSSAFQPLFRQIAETIAKDGTKAGLALVQRAIRDADERAMNENGLLTWMESLKVDATELGAVMAYLHHREQELTQIEPQEQPGFTSSEDRPEGRDARKDDR